MRWWRSVWNDVKNRRNIEAYVATAVAVVFATLGIIGDVVPDDMKWSALFAGLGLLIFRIAVPVRPSASIESLLSDRATFSTTPFSSLVDGARQVWIFAPSAVNVLNAANCDLLRRSVLNRGDGDLRVVVLDPSSSNSSNIALAVRQLDDSLDYPVQDFRMALATTVDQLHRMAYWEVVGHFDYGYCGYNPGFSMVAIDPSMKNGKLIVEFHGFKNEATESRMHIALTRHDSEKWFHYWIQQYEAIWNDARSEDSSDVS